VPANTLVAQHPYAVLFAETSVRIGDAVQARYAALRRLHKFWMRSAEATVDTVQPRIALPGMRSRNIRAYPLSDYDSTSAAELGIFVGRFELLEQRFRRPASPHRHDHFELFWVRGPAVLVHDFARYDIPADRRSFVFISPGQVHFWRGTEAIRGTLISFTHAFFDGRESPPSALSGLNFGYGGEPLWAADSEFESAAAPLVERCEVDFTAREFGWAELVRSSLRQILIHAQRAFVRLKPSRGPDRAHSLLRRLNALVESHFREDATVAAYARKLGVTPGHLSDVVRSLTGEAAGELIRRRRMLEARRLLFHSDQSVSEIAFELGFEDSSYFAKAFRRATGLSPGDFRAEMRASLKA
jgi:AraC family transcriptional regulator, transcriptional activator of pobA